jgi:hypothetical protein
MHQDAAMKAENSSVSEVEVTPATEKTNASKAASLAVPQFSDREDAFLMTQYISLREEILKRIEIQHQLILGTLVAVGTILTVGTQGGSLSILLVYPFLAMFLTLAWSQNDHRNRQISEHLGRHEEVFLKDTALAWEKSRRSSRLWIFGSRKVFAARGIFVGSQVLTILLYWFTVNSSNQAIGRDDAVLMLTGIIVTLLTLLMIGFPSRHTGH